MLDLSGRYLAILRRSLPMELIRQLQEWHRADIYQELLTVADKTQTPITVNSILRSMEYGAFADKPSGYQPYRDLIATVGVGPLMDGMVYVFNHDPSRHQKELLTVEDCFNESPVPRYLVSLCYAILHRQLMPQDQLDACARSQTSTLAEAIWCNIVDTGNLLVYPSAMVTVLTDRFSVQELLMRSLPLIADDRPTANKVGDILLYQLTLEDEALVDDVNQKLQHAIDSESDRAKKAKYQKYLKRRSRSNLYAVADLINPWKQN